MKLDESYSGGICKGKCGRGVGSKTVIGLLKRNDKVFVVKDTKTDALILITINKIKLDSIYTDSYKSYSTLDVSDSRYFKGLHKIATISMPLKTSGRKPNECLENDV